jgi:hypothetical protein
MWAQYKKTFLRIQIVIMLVTCAAFVATGYRAPAASVFFTVMQIGAVLGAMWGVRMQARIGVSR